MQFLLDIPVRIKILLMRIMLRLGLREDSGLVVLAVVIGAITSAAAVSFHWLIVHIRFWMYQSVGADFLYGQGLWLLVLYPAVGGLVVGIISRYVLHGREGHGVVDVMESVIRTRGFVKPMSAIEKILTSGITIGSGGSAGAEGPIVQIGAAVASGVGQLFRIGRRHMPLLVGCGSAAGISSIFHSPIGGVLFTLEVILQDFSIRTFMPVVVASVVANVATQSIYARLGEEKYQAIFELPAMSQWGSAITWGQSLHFALLGLLCGIVGVVFVKAMFAMENAFSRLKKLGAWCPMIGGAMLGIMGVAFVLWFSTWLGVPKPIPFSQYPLPAFFSDGYGVIRAMLDGSIVMSASTGATIALLLAMIVLKLLGTSVTLGSGGSGGVIAPSLFMGATIGTLLAVILQAGGSHTVAMRGMAIVGMGAVLSAVVHAPLASILIIFELTRDPDLIVPAMLGTVIATAVAKMIFPDSIYSHGLRRRGVVTGGGADFAVLRRIHVESIPLEPLMSVKAGEPLQKVIERMSDTRLCDCIVLDHTGMLVGLLVSDDLRFSLLNREALPALTVGDVMRTKVPLLRPSDDLTTALEIFSQVAIDVLPVATDGQTHRVIGLLTRVAMMRAYHAALREIS